MLGHDAGHRPTRTDPTDWLADWHQRSRRADDEVRARTRRASAFCHLSRAQRTLARSRRDWKTDDGARGEEVPTKGRKRQTEERSGARKRKMTTTHEVSLHVYDLRCALSVFRRSRVHASSVVYSRNVTRRVGEGRDEASSRRKVLEGWKD